MTSPTNWMPAICPANWHCCRSSKSAYDPFAYSHGQASGAWQFVAPTAREYGLEINDFYDGRRDVYAATRGRAGLSRNAATIVSAATGTSPWRPITEVRAGSAGLSGATAPASTRPHGISFRCHAKPWPMCRNCTVWAACFANRNATDGPVRSGRISPRSRGSSFPGQSTLWCCRHWPSWI